jgi:cytochrome c oxidase subunit 3
MISAAPSTARGDDTGRGGRRRSRLPAGKIGLWTFMGVVTTLFLLLTIAFLSRSQLGDWRALGDPGQPLSNPSPLWMNTAMLVASSIMMQIASMSARRGNLMWARIGLVLGGIFAAAFISGQLEFWQTLANAGYFVASNPANSFFYLITGLHGLHLLGGLVAWAVITTKTWRAQAPIGGESRLPLGIELAANYWHFLLAVWLAMFALLASPESITTTLARMCGIR